MPIRGRNYGARTWIDWLPSYWSYRLLQWWLGGTGEAIWCYTPIYATSLQCTAGRIWHCYMWVRIHPNNNFFSPLWNVFSLLGDALIHERHSTIIWYRSPLSADAFYQFYFCCSHIIWIFNAESGWPAVAGIVAWFEGVSNFLVL